MTKKRFDDTKGELAILGKTKQELIAMMPQNAASEHVSQQPAAVAIKMAIDNIAQAKQKKEEYLNEAVQELTNMNIISELMEVHQGTVNKEELLNKKKEEYNVFFKRIAEQEHLMIASKDVI